MKNRKKKTALPLRDSGGPKTGSKDIIKAIQAQIILHNYPMQYDEIWANVKTNRICLVKWDAFGMGRDCTVIKSVPAMTTTQGAETVAQIGREFGAGVLHCITVDFKEYCKFRCAEKKGGGVCLN